MHFFQRRVAENNCKIGLYIRPRDGAAENRKKKLPLFSRDFLKRDILMSNIFEIVFLLLLLLPFFLIIILGTKFVVLEL